MKITYGVWRLKVIALVPDMQLAYTKYCHFLSEWDRGAKHPCGRRRRQAIFLFCRNLLTASPYQTWNFEEFP